MNLWTLEARALMDEIRPYIKNHKVIPDAPMEIKEKYDQLKKMLSDEEDRQIAMMCK